MKKPVDRLFEEKLSHLEVMPSFDAWNQIQEQLQSEKKPAQWHYIAASITAIMVIGSVLWWQLTPTSIPVNEVTVAKLSAPAPIEKKASHIETTTPVMDPVETKPSIVASTVEPKEFVIDPVEDSTPGDLLIAEASVSIQTRGVNLEVNSSTLDLDFYPMYVADGKLDDNKLQRVWQYAQKVKNGESKPLNLRKAKSDLLAFAKSKFKSEESTSLNFD